MKLHLSEEFHKWLNQCPCEWFREEITDEEGEKTATYTFREVKP